MTAGDHRHVLRSNFARQRLHQGLRGIPKQPETPVEQLTTAISAIVPADEPQDVQHEITK